MMVILVSTEVNSSDTFDKILFLGGSFTKVLNNIRPHDGFDKLRKEVELYQVDEEVRKIDPNLSYNNYWMKVEEITEGSEEWVVYEARNSRYLLTN